MKNPVRNVVVLLLGTGAAILGAVNWWVVGLEPGSSIATTGADNKAAAPGSIAPPPETAPLSDFAEIVRRPLFSVDRRAFFPPSATSVLAQSGDKPRDVRLTGVAIAATRRQALLQVSGQPQAHWIEEGGSIDGWLLQSVQNDAVILISGRQQYELRLYPGLSSGR